VAEEGWRRNRYFEWALTRTEYHYEGNPNGEALHRALNTELDTMVGEFSPASFIEACRRSSGG
jgi:hypothetical protein